MSSTSILRAVVGASLALLLSACATGHPMDCVTGFVAWNDCPVGSKGYVRRQALLAQDKEKCAAYGFKEGTDNYATCVMTLDQNRDESNDRLLAGILASMPKQAPPPPSAPPPVPKLNPGVICNSTQVGGSVVTQCNQ